MHIQRMVFIVAFSAILSAQSSDAYKNFFSQLNELEHRPVNGQLVESAPRIQSDLGVTAEDAESMLTIAREYQSQVSAIDQDLRRAVLEYRLARTADEQASTPPEAELVAQSKRKAEILALVKMEQLKARLGETKFQALENLIDTRRDKGLFPPEVSNRPSAKR